MSDDEVNFNANEKKSLRMASSLINDTSEPLIKRSSTELQKRTRKSYDGVNSTNYKLLPIEDKKVDDIEA